MSRRFTADQTTWKILQGESLPEEITLGRYAILIDETVKSMHSDWLHRLLDANPSCLGVFEIPSGETSKSIRQWEHLTDQLFATGMRRNDSLLAIGGGVTGDLAGFVASTLFRGVRLIHIPTTLLAMVDSSIGGKVGINHSSGKNRIGAFYPAEWILIHTDFLKTLSKREWVNGFAEMLKYGYIRNPKMLEELILFPQWLKLDQLDQHQTPAFTSSEWSELIDRLEKWITESWKIKQQIVTDDEFEQGDRMFLNFGHTFGHALEQVLGYGRIDHGVAVLAGMVCAGILSNKHINKPEMRISLDPLEPFIRLTADHWNEIREKAHIVETLVHEMNSDKKNQSNHIRLILLRSVGNPFIFETSDPSELEAIWGRAFAWIADSTGIRKGGP